MSDIPQGSPISGVPSDCCNHFIHHLGVLLFSAVLLKVEALMGEMGWLAKLGILTDDWERPAEELIRLMFKRWLQEHDFKYLEKHFDINQITSYAWVSYKNLKDQVEDKQMKSGEYKALRRIVEDLFEQINANGLRIPDGSERPITFKLGEKAGIELANTNSSFSPK